MDDSITLPERIPVMPFPSDRGHRAARIGVEQLGAPTRSAPKGSSFTLEIEPDDTEAMNNMAWILATCPDPLVRDRAKAIELAQCADSIRAQIEVYQSGAAFGDRRYATSSP